MKILSPHQEVNLFTNKLNLISLFVCNRSETEMQQMGESSAPNDAVSTPLSGETRSDNLVLSSSDHCRLAIDQERTVSVLHIPTYLLCLLFVLFFCSCIIHKWFV